MVLSALLCFGFFDTVTAQCPNCTIALPVGIPADTILIDSLIPAYKNAYYEEGISYRLPYTTDPLAAVAPPGTNVPLGVSIDDFTILSVTGLPPGLTWTGDRPAPMVYDEAAPQTRDGCITLCGIPGASGTFNINVNLGIRIAGFVVPSPPIPLEFIVFPDTNASFLLDTSGGCAPFGAVITNLIPSNGNAGFSYAWDFGNGMTSIAENPDTVWYNFNMTSDTVVAITQQVIIDTFPYLLESIVVAADPGNSCNDDVGFPPFVVAGAPDMYMIMIGHGDTINTDPNFALIGNTQNNEYPRDTMVFPGPIELGAGQMYSLEIWDDDTAVPFGTDDPCGSGPVTFSAALGVGVHTLTSGSMTIEITLSHYIDTINYVDSVRVQYCNVSVDQIKNVERSLSIYPNPTSDAVNIQFQLNGGSKDVDLVLSDVLGRTLYTEQMKNFNGTYNQPLDLSREANGVYILHLRVGSDVISRKIVLQK